MSNKFFISDTHFGHENVIRFDCRPFSSAEEMDEVMIANWNSVVKSDDEVYHLGDFAFHGATKVREIIGRLNGQIHLIYGNHDKVIWKNKDIVNMFASVSEYREIRANDLTICLFHYPIGEWNKVHRGAYHLHGHCHGNYVHPREGRIMDVGACCIDYTPISLDEVVARLHSKPLLQFN